MGFNSLYYVSSWKSKELSNECLKLRTTSGNSLTPILNYYDGPKIKVSFDISCLKQDRVTFSHGKIVNIYIVYKRMRITNINCDRDSNLTVEDCLFGTVTLTKNADIDKYSGYGIGFNRRSRFSFPVGGDGQNIIIFGVDMSLSVHIGNKGKDSLILGKGPTQGLGEHSLTAEKMYSINFSKDTLKFCLSLHYNGANSYLFNNGTEINKFKAKNSKIVASPLCLENISKDWSTDNMKKQDLLVMFMILVQIIVLLHLIILKIFIIIW